MKVPGPALVHISKLPCCFSRSYVFSGKGRPLSSPGETQLGPVGRSVLQPGPGSGPFSLGGPPGRQVRRAGPAPLLGRSCRQAFGWAAALPLARERLEWDRRGGPRGSRSEPSATCWREEARRRPHRGHTVTGICRPLPSPTHLRPATVTHPLRETWGPEGFFSPISGDPARLTSRCLCPQRCGVRETFPSANATTT